MAVQYKVAILDIEHIDSTSGIEYELNQIGVSDWELIQLIRYELDEAEGKTKGMFIFKK